jgi:glycosidase
MVTERGLKFRLMEFHVSRASRDTYQFDDSLFGLTGNVVLADFFAARVFAARLSSAGRPAQPGELNAMGLIDEISHMLIAEYRKSINPGAMRKALAHVRDTLGAEQVDSTLARFASEFPTVAVYRGLQTQTAYLSGATEGTPNTEVALEEMLLLWLSNSNPAFMRYGELFEDTALARDTAYLPIIEALTGFFGAQPPLFENQSLISVLRLPAQAHPDSLDAQLGFIRTYWVNAVPVLRAYGLRVLRGQDLIKEEARSFAAWFGPGGPGATARPVDQAFLGMGKPEFSDDEIRTAIRANYATDPEYEAYTVDRAWMPRLVLLAKNAFVWLDQLSKQYGREISRLDQIPDEALDQMQRWGITGLWLIGLWERSHASKRVKQMMGAHDAVASAYSLMGYRIADDLGGEEAMRVLKERAWKRGIRMGSDMVPNHFGVDSDWVVNYPDAFLSLDHPPYPNYTFNSPDLSEDSRVGIFLEDHYYDRTDAAVVFKRLDRHTGDVKYIYHGNDGTSMPWNDTAQLDYLKADVREAVIRVILDVAKQFPIIRFDAAMTLAKRHIQRLWFPIPGSGDGIPSRAGMGVTKEEFDRLMPVEFWREVVDRAAVEAPDTLLLAEAFWMLEGYFVRTLGMHRVYNSAFMHMLRDEDNAKYRYLIKETLEFDPQILKRYVNFMNNPDEKTAIEQYGKGDKYFGVALLMSTLPGLPMYGHGQVEGYTEKYGMEYRRAKLDEKPDQGLIDYHARMVFPILHKRYLFAEVDHFYLYDFYTTGGGVSEDVFAYSNQHGDERTLVLYHNRNARTAGYVRVSAAYLVKGEGMRQTTLGDAFKLHNDDQHFLLFRDHVTGLEFIRSSREIYERGLFVELGEYKSHIFLDIQEVYDADGRYARLTAQLNGRGVGNLAQAAREIAYGSILAPTRALINADTLKLMHGSRIDAAQVKRGKTPAVDATLLETIGQRALTLAGEAARLSAGAHAETVSQATVDAVSAVLQLAVFNKRFAPRLRKPLIDADLSLDDIAPLYVWALLHRLGGVKHTSAAAVAAQTAAWLDEWSLRQPVADAFVGLDVPADARGRAMSLTRALIARAGLLGEACTAAFVSRKARPKAAATAAAARTTTATKTRSAEKPDVEAGLAVLMADTGFYRAVGANVWDGATYVNKEAFEGLIDLLLLAEAVQASDDSAKAAAATRVRRASVLAAAIKNDVAQRGYKVTAAAATV